MSTLIGDIRVVNKWELIEPEWDGVTLPRPKSSLEVTWLITFNELGEICLSINIRFSGDIFV